MHFVSGFCFRSLSLVLLVKKFNKLIAYLCAITYELELKLRETVNSSFSSISSFLLKRNVMQGLSYKKNRILCQENEIKTHLLLSIHCMQCIKSKYTQQFYNYIVRWVCTHKCSYSIYICVWKVFVVCVCSNSMHF